MSSPINPFIELSEAEYYENSNLTPARCRALYDNAKASFDLLDKMPVILYQSNGEYQSSRGGSSGTAEYVYSCTNASWVTVLKTKIKIPNLPYLNGSGVAVNAKIGYSVYAWRNSASYVSQLKVLIDGVDIGTTQTISTTGNPPATPNTLKQSRDLTDAEKGGSDYYKLCMLEMKFLTTTGYVSTTWQIAATGLIVVFYNPANVTW